MKSIEILAVQASYKREPLIEPFGFKGAFLTELWQSQVRIESASGAVGSCVSTQSVLYTDPQIFASNSEEEANELMFRLSASVLEHCRGMSFESPAELLQALLPFARSEAIRLCGTAAVSEMFVLNALVGIDHAAWLLYAAENELPTFDSMIPVPYRELFLHRLDKLAVMYMVSYGMKLSDLRVAAEEGYFVFKIKIGQPGSQQEMLARDKARLSEIHAVLDSFSTEQTPSGKILYTLDANGRYEEKESLAALLEHARQIGAFDRILFVEEPFDDKNECAVGDLGLPIAADESACSADSTLRRIRQGYSVIILKSIAKTLSLTFDIAKVAYDHQVPCVFADLTANPSLLEWHKNLAARIAPFPNLGLGLLETNGHLNYRNWVEMGGRDVRGGWLEVKINE